MNQYVLINIFIFFLLIEVESQAPPDSNDRVAGVSTFRPSVAVVVGVLSIMFALTFLLLIYAKFCHVSTVDALNRRQGQQPILGPGLARATSGIDKAVIQSLPFFRFSSLKGSKEGLECAVCLSKFEETETLRLLPKCKHAFHVNCVDKWLEIHSSCPLCRLKVDPEDKSIFMHSASMRISRTQSDLSEDPDVELFVRREAEGLGSSRFSVGSSFRMIGNAALEGTPVASSRFSTPKSSNAASSAHETGSNVMFETEGSRMDRSNSVSGSNLPSTSESRHLLPTEKRSMSEIINLSRYVDRFSPKNRSKESPSGANSGREENMTRLWSPRQSQNPRQNSIV